MWLWAGIIFGGNNGRNSEGRLRWICWRILVDFCQSTVSVENRPEQRRREKFPHLFVEFLQKNELKDISDNLESFWNNYRGERRQKLYKCLQPGACTAETNNFSFHFNHSRGSQRWPAICGQQWPRRQHQQQFISIQCKFIDRLPTTSIYIFIVIPCIGCSSNDISNPAASFLSDRSYQYYCMTTVLDV